MNEIEEFLRRAAAMRAQQGQQARRTPAVPRPPAPVEPVMDAEVVDAEEVTGEAVAQDVAKHLDTRGFATRASALAGSVRASEEVIEAHMHEVFEHKLGQLGGTTSAIAQSKLDDPESAAKAEPMDASKLDFRDMLRSPQNIRNAILLSELLNPPYHRW